MSYRNKYVRTNGYDKLLSRVYSRDMCDIFDIDSIQLGEGIPLPDLIDVILISGADKFSIIIDWFDEVFNQLDSSIETKWQVNDGDKIKPNQILCNINGPICPILTGERTAINFIQSFSTMMLSSSMLQS